MAIPTPSPDIWTLKALKDFSTQASITTSQYLLMIGTIGTGDGAKIKLENFLTSSVSSDSGNLLEVGTDDKLAVTSSTITKQGNTFNGNSQLVQTTAGGLLPVLDGSNLTNVGAEHIMRIATCATASATAEKVVTISGVSLVAGLTIAVNFTNANTEAVPTINFNSTVDAIYDESGNAVSATNPAYFPAGANIEFYFDGTNWVLKNRIVEAYVNATSGYNVSANGLIEQWGLIPVSTTNVPLPVEYLGTDYLLLISYYDLSSDGTTVTRSNISGDDRETTNFDTVTSNGVRMWYTKGY